MSARKTEMKEEVEEGKRNKKRQVRRKIKWRTGLKWKKREQVRERENGEDLRVQGGEENAMREIKRGNGRGK